MNKVKMFVLGAVEVEAQGGPIAQCSWNGENCFDPIDQNMCICEEKEEDN